MNKNKVITFLRDVFNGCYNEEMGGGEHFCDYTSCEEVISVAKELGLNDLVEELEPRLEEL
jgi:hypothetical protein